MLLNKISQNMTSFRRYIVLGIFLFLIILPSFFSGEWSKWLQAVIFIVIFLLILYTVILTTRNHTFGNKFYTNPNFYLILFLIIVFITSFFSVNKYNSFSLLFLLLSYAAVYFAAYFYFRNWRLIKIITHFIFFVGVLASLIALFMFTFQSANRAYGLLFNSNALGSYLLFGLPLGIVLTLWYRNSIFRYLYFFGFLVVCLTFLLTYSYTGWVSFIVPFLILILYFRKIIFTRRHTLILLIILLIGFIFLTFFRYQQSHNLKEAILVYKTISSESLIFSFSQRLLFNQSAWEIFKDYSLTGSGYNTFQSIYARYYHTVFEQPRYTHNYYLQTAAETGIFGFLALIIFLILLFRNSFKVIKKEKEEEKKYYLLGLSLGVLGSAIHSLFDFGWQFPAVFILFWLEAGMLMAWGKKTTDHGLQTTARQIEKVGVSTLWPRVVKTITIILALIIFIRGLTVFAGAYYLQQATSAADNGDLENEYKYYENSFKFDPDSINLANYIQERIKFPFILKADDYKMMEDKLQKQLSINTENYYVHWTLGKVYFLQDKFSLAEDEYKEAIKYNPVFRPDVYYDLAFLYFQQKNYDQSIKTIFSILEKYPEGIGSSNPNLPTQLAFLNLLLGKNYLEEGKKDLAKQYFNKALEYKPDFDLAKKELEGLKISTDF